MNGSLSTYSFDSVTSDCARILQALEQVLNLLLFKLRSLAVIWSELLYQLEDQGRSLTSVDCFVVFKVLQVIHYGDSLEKVYNLFQILFRLGKIHLI